MSLCSDCELGKKSINSLKDLFSERGKTNQGKLSVIYVKNQMQAGQQSCQCLISVSS